MPNLQTTYCTYSSYYSFYSVIKENRCFKKSSHGGGERGFSIVSLKTRLLTISAWFSSMLLPWLSSAHCSDQQLNCIQVKIQSKALWLYKSNRNLFINKKQWQQKRKKIIIIIPPVLQDSWASLQPRQQLENKTTKHCFITGSSDARSVLAVLKTGRV